jgi:hypothetical protein
MNTEQRIAFRKLLSDCLMYMSEKGRDRNEILTVMQKLKDAVQNIIDTELHEVYTNAPTYRMNPEDEIRFRQMIALTLDRISKPGTTPLQVLEMINGVEDWIKIKSEKAARAAIEKPRLRVERKKDLPN